MNKKIKLIDVLVIGSGLSSLVFLHSYLKKRKGVEVISPNLNFKKFDNNNTAQHITNILPPQMIGTDEKVKNYFRLNKINLSENCKVFGSLEFGGLSNYWGLQIDPNILNDIKNLSSKTKKEISKSFIELLKEFNLAGKYQNYQNSFEGDDFFSITNKDRSSLQFEDFIIGYKNVFDKKKKIDDVNEVSDKFVPKNYYNKFLKKKKIKFHNYFVKKIKKHGKIVEVLCSDGSVNKSFYAKKLVIGSGTVVTTKLILDYLKIKKEIKLKHHPRLFSLYFSSKKWRNKMSFQPSQVHLKPRKGTELFTADFRPGNKLIINSIIQFKKYLAIFKPILNYFRFNMVFSNTLLHSKFSNIYLKLENNNTLRIYSKNKKIDNVFKYTSNLVFNFLRKQKKILPLRINYFPGYGSDFHYFGTLQIGGKGKLSVNEKCQLTNNKNIYIIDGSVFNFKKNKYPLGLILANAKRIAKKIID
tara:strand:+ start:390 stop:1802 length:1413 start_codon:yes stop_codon:yes gene_type:complete